jgi:hypothetical protein
LFSLPKTIGSVVGTEKEGKKSKKAKKKMEEKIDKKRIGMEKHHDQVVPQQISEGRIE